MNTKETKATTTTTAGSLTSEAKSLKPLTVTLKNGFKSTSRSKRAVVTEMFNSQWYSKTLEDFMRDMARRLGEMQMPIEFEDGNPDSFYDALKKAGHLKEHDEPL